jgi:hypothetical protein
LECARVHQLLTYTFRPPLTHPGLSLGKIIKEIEESLPGIYVLSINLAGPDGDVGADRKASFFGNANDQVEAVCQELAEDKYLADGFNAIGFSQVVYPNASM